MSKYEMIAFIVAVSTMGATISTIARAYIKRLETRGTPQPPHRMSSAADEERLERIERAVEAVAIEVERISEGQRFTTRLLAERSGAGGVPSATSGAKGNALGGGGSAD